MPSNEGFGTGFEQSTAVATVVTQSDPVGSALCLAARTDEEATIGKDEDAHGKIELRNPSVQVAATVNIPMVKFEVRATDVLPREVKHRI